MDALDVPAKWDIYICMGTSCICSSKGEGYSLVTLNQVWAVLQKDGIACSNGELGLNTADGCHSFKVYKLWCRLDAVMRMCVCVCVCVCVCGVWVCMRVIGVEIHS